MRLYYRTIRHLKLIQLWYRLWYGLRRKFRQLTGHSYPIAIRREGHRLKLQEGMSKPVTFRNRTFTFLNRPHSFNGPIDWNLDTHGKLWAYHLNYFDFLHQPTMTRQQGLQLIEEFIGQLEKNGEGMEPYPISLRGINWIKFMAKYGIDNPEIDASLYAQYRVLLDNLEYHVLGNHLLENACSLLVAALYFRDQVFWSKAEELIERELEEQILPDGGHYERSVMYHSILLERLMDCFNLLIQNKYFSGQRDLVKVIQPRLERMLGWLKQMQWDNGDLPEVNDHIPEMTPRPGELFEYAGRLGLEPLETGLGTSGYRKYRGARYELLADVGIIGPDYVPGHAHSDIFSFIMRVDGREIITDTGTSTYEWNDRRREERSTSAHNTIAIDGKEQNEVWAAFRVGRRGHVRLVKNQNDMIAAEHDGYGFLNIIHQRKFTFSRDAVTIQDRLRGESDGKSAIAYLHFSPGINLRIHRDRITGDNFQITLDGHNNLDLETYHKATGYNTLRDGKCVRIYFHKELMTKIEARFDR